MLDNAQLKLDTAQNESKKIIDSAKKDSENLIIEMNDKFYKSTEIKKNSAQLKIKQIHIFPLFFVIYSQNTNITIPLGIPSFEINFNH